jgi:hypothetical protein
MYGAQLCPQFMLKFVGLYGEISDLRISKASFCQRTGQSVVSHSIEVS